MATKNTATLSRLGASGQTVADPAEDIRGRRVKDKDGDDIGQVADLLIDSQDRKVRFLRVEHGGILGFGATASFIPVDAISRITGYTADELGTLADLAAIVHPDDRLALQAHSPSLRRQN